MQWITRRKNSQIGDWMCSNLPTSALGWDISSWFVLLKVTRGTPSSFSKSSSSLPEVKLNIYSPRTRNSSIADARNAEVRLADAASSHTCSWNIHKLTNHKLRLWQVESLWKYIYCSLFNLGIRSARKMFNLNTEIFCEFQELSRIIRHPLRKMHIWPVTLDEWLLTSMQKVK